MTAHRSALPTEPHPMLSGVLTDWHEKAGALSALPGAPVVTDDSGARRRAWRRLRSRWGPARPRR